MFLYARTDKCTDGRFGCINGRKKDMKPLQPLQSVPYFQSGQIGGIGGSFKTSTS